MTIFKLFAEPVGTDGNALINWKGDPAEEIVAYAWTYQRAAITLVQTCRRWQYHAIDNDALPIMFLYRHSFELYLKALAYHAALQSIEKRELVRTLPRLWKEHSLMKLVELCDPVLSGSHPLAGYGDLRKEVYALAKELDAVDPGSYSFRYPTSTRGDASLPPNLFTNVYTFSSAMEGMFDNLAQFCRSLQNQRDAVADQMKLSMPALK